MKKIKLVSVLVMVTLLIASLEMPAQTETKNKIKMKILFHITIGPENPTRAALAFLMAKTAIEEGHTVNLFLAGDAVSLLRNQVLDNLVGVGTGKLSEHYDAIVKGGAKFYLSGMSSKARGVTDADIQGKPVEFAMPNVLLRLTIESDKMFVY